ncbi:MAG: hypothetical protein K9G27_05815 [Sphingomonadaceae bacterium]|jgi:hypothetical protein|uniref:hypothetical protein n=1 Tax=Sphingorhabdus sp. TaxID=1902408 RepID=UPI002FDA043E|nr:hypothetical protein [Sphingomonadaceae bacterium]
MNCKALAVGLALVLAWPALATPMIVVEARGGGLKPGMRIDSARSVKLVEGEKIVLVAPDGRMSTLRGPYSGPAVRNAGSVQNPRTALAALIATRNDRASSVGAVRSGASAAPLPEPWLIDISRGGDRCIKEGEKPVWWRPESLTEQAFSVFPVDRSWRADYVWKASADRMTPPDIVGLDDLKTFIVRAGGQEYPLRINMIPRDIDDPLVISAWMLEKACVQQADSYLMAIGKDLADSATSLGDGEPQTGALQK